MNQNRTLLMIILVLIFIPSVQADALDYDCVTRTPLCNADEVTVLSLSQASNAQAAEPLGPNSYDTKICCKGAGLGTDCAAPFTSIITRLEQQRNSHAQEWLIMAPQYPFEYCLDSTTSFSCFYETTCQNTTKCVLELSRDRNAHISECQPVDTGRIKVCCGFQAYCGNGIVEPGEECDWSAPDAFGHVQNCTFLDEFNNNNADRLFCGDTCFFNTTDCEKNNPQNALCGNGIIDINETCDFKDLSTIPPLEEWGPITGCHWFDSWTGGNLSCLPPGSEYECHFNTTGCLPGVYPTPMICGRVYHENPGISYLNTSACNDTGYPKNPPPPEFLCQTEYDCLYANETDFTAPYFPVCIPDGGTWKNMAGQNITCHGKDSLGNRLNTWCPEHFTWDEGLEYCVFQENICDSGRMYDPLHYLDYEANCSLHVSQWEINYSLGNQCMEPDDLDGWPDDMYPKNGVCCRNFSVADYNDTVNFLRPYGFYNNMSVLVY